jgi:hypothetical protein
MTTTRRYLAFDIETARLPEGDWRSSRPLGISCAATFLADSREPTLWYGGDRARPADRMSRDEAAELVGYLTTPVGRGYTLLTWNGVGFDLDVLVAESGMREECKRLALAHVDTRAPPPHKREEGQDTEVHGQGFGKSGVVVIDGVSDLLVPGRTTANE